MLKRKGQGPHRPESFDPELWVAWLENCKRRGATRAPRKAILDLTELALVEGGYTVQGVWVSLERPSPVILCRPLPPPPRVSSALPPVALIDGDIVEVALRVARHHADETVGLLDPASQFHAGGEARRGAGALEEHLCRSSDLLSQLEAMRYPLKGAVALPHVRFFRGPEATGYPFLQEPSTLGVLVAAAMNGAKPGVLDRAGFLTTGAVTEMRRRTEDLVAVAEANFEHAVFCAWGCGAFRLPAVQVVMFFKDALRGSSLRSVTFALLGDHNSEGIDLTGIFKSAFATGQRTSEEV